MNCFVVTGEFITQQARAFWNDEGEPEKAMSLMECLHGISQDQIMDVLEGRSKLVGDSSSGVDLVPDGTYQGKTFRQVVGALRAQRDEAEDEREDIAQMTARDVVLVASPTGRRLIPRRKAQRTYSTLYTLMTLCDGYEFDDLMDTAKPGTKRQRVWEQLDPVNPTPQMLDVLDTVERVRGSADPIPVVEVEDEEERRPPPPEPESTITGGTGWLSPEGKFYPCGYAQHARTAWSLGLTNNPYNHGVEVDGWVRLGVMADDRQYFFGDHKTFNDTVKRMVRVYCQENSIELPFWLSDDAL